MGVEGWLGDAELATDISHGEGAIGLLKGVGDWLFAPCIVVLLLSRVAKSLVRSGFTLSSFSRRRRGGEVLVLSFLIREKFM